MPIHQLLSALAYFKILRTAHLVLISTPLLLNITHLISHGLCDIEIVEAQRDASLSLQFR